MSSSSPSTRKIISSVERALDILNLFNYENPELGNTEIAKLVNLPNGTVSGLVYTLKVKGYLDQNPINRKYRLGLKLAERGSILLNQMDIRKIAAPYLEALRDWSGESTNLAIRDGDEVVYIERLFSSHPLGIRSEIGKRGSIHSTALGKAICAFLPYKERASLLENYNFLTITPYSIHNLERFSKEISVIREKGFAIDEEENELGGRCVGAPIFDHDGYPIAAVSISVPIQRLPEKDLEKFGSKIKETADAISKQMGFLGGKNDIRS